MKRVQVLKGFINNETRKTDWVSDGEANFHQFGLDAEEGDSGFASYSIAIIERDDGKVEMVRADRIQFIKPISASAPDANKVNPEIVDLIAATRRVVTEYRAASLYPDAIDRAEYALAAIDAK